MFLKSVDYRTIFELNLIKIKKIGIEII